MTAPKEREEIQTKRIDIKAILANPELRKKLIKFAVAALVDAKWIR